MPLLFCCNPTGINDPEKRNENWCWYVDKTTGTGKWIPILDECSLINGDYTLFYSNGVVSENGTIKVNNSIDTIIYYDIYGKFISMDLKVADSIIKQYRPDGKYVTYYSTCELFEEGEFKNNKQVGMLTGYFKNGKIKFKHVAYGDSLLIMNYFESGQIKDSFWNVKEQVEGIVKVWYEDGKVEKYLNYKNGLKDGLCIWYFRNGQIDVKRYYRNDTMNGPSTEYFENSVIRLDVPFKNGEKDGLEISYHENGNLHGNVNWKEGKKNGDILFYHSNGTIEMRAFAVMDEIKYYKKYDTTGKLIKYYNSANINN